MATYKEIQDDVWATSGRAVKTCWIADVKASHGLVSRCAPNRISVEQRKYPRSPGARPLIEDSLREFGMLGDSA